MAKRTKQSSDGRQLLADWGIDIDGELLVLALTHRSFAHEQGGLPTNERLEFLGDAVLSIVVTEWLYKHFPDHPEGHLAKMRAATVSQPALAAVARNIGLGKYVLLGVGEDAQGGRDKDSILSDTLEAMIGATYLAHGLEPTRQVVEKLLGVLLTDVETRGAGIDWKTTLQELAAALDMEVPYYEHTDKGPDHAKVFTATAIIGEEEVSKGQASSKKLAEHEAAARAVAALVEKYQLQTPIGFDVDAAAVRREVRARTS
ncbi:MAG: ribonuclease III [Actinomycetaceae bacterium]|nr:ribonuclease III [Actinomycetaceae bacterium]